MAKTDKKQPTFTHRDAVNFYEQKEIAERTKIPKPEITYPALSNQSQSVESIVILLNDRIAELQDMKGLSKRETELPINELEYMLSKINGGKYLSTEGIVGFVLEWVAPRVKNPERYGMAGIDNADILTMKADIIKHLTNPHTGNGK